MIGIVALSPIFIATAIAVRIDSKGPSIFSQERFEQDGRIFKITSDPRVTRLGRFIRKTSIDELPQLFNVLIGNMPLVGPRPNLPDEVAAFEVS